ncbi:hypothetical protein V2J09_018055 [Rumex salicifolius]
MNPVTLSKLGWHVLQEQTALWSRVIQGKYCHSGLDVDMKHPSHTWLGIVHEAQLLMNGVHIAMGNGTSTLFCLHHGLMENLLTDHVTSNFPHDSEFAIVKEL